MISIVLPDSNPGVVRIANQPAGSKDSLPRRPAEGLFDTKKDLFDSDESLFGTEEGLFETEQKA